MKLIDKTEDPNYKLSRTEQNKMKKQEEEKEKQFEKEIKELLNLNITIELDKSIYIDLLYLEEEKEKIINSTIKDIEKNFEKIKI